VPRGLAGVALSRSSTWNRRSSCSRESSTGEQCTLLYSSYEYDSENWPVILGHSEVIQFDGLSECRTCAFGSGDMESVRGRTRIGTAKSASVREYAGSNLRDLPDLPGMCYMMGKQGYGGEVAPHWPAQLMFFYSDTDPAIWGANLPGSPVLAVADPEEHLTQFIIPTQRWSDGTEDLPAPHVHP
jgi:hypothetical protein